MITVEKDRRITTKTGQTFSDDMKVVTGNAAAAIALRDAVFKAIPRSIVQSVYRRCRQLVAGEVKPMSEKIGTAFDQFSAVGVTETMVLEHCGVGSREGITGEHLANLFGLYNAIVEEETTVAEAFPRRVEKAREDATSDLRKKIDGLPGRPAPETAAETTEPAGETQEPGDAPGKAPGDLPDISAAELAAKLNTTAPKLREFFIHKGTLPRGGSLRGLLPEYRRDLYDNPEETREEIAAWIAGAN